MIAARRSRAANAQHSQASCEHGTPREIVELARHALGGIDLDVCTSEYWNRYSVQAADFYDRRRNGLDPRNPWAGRVFCNPPGADDKAKSRNLVGPFWARMVTAWRAGQIDGAVWIGYSLEQLVKLQGSSWSPLRCLVLVPRDRLEFLQPRPGLPPVPGGSPTHGNFVALLSSWRFDAIARAQCARFLERGRELGSIVRPA